MGYETEAWRAPKPLEDDAVIFSEHGRSVNNTDFTSHWLMLVKPKYGEYCILVKHGGGEERIEVGWQHTATGLLALRHLDADQRYLVLYTILSVHEDARRKAKQDTAARYQRAFLDGRLKRKKRNHLYYVEIVQEVTEGR